MTSPEPEFPLGGAYNAVLRLDGFVFQHHNVLDIEQNATVEDEVTILRRSLLTGPFEIVADRVDIVGRTLRWRDTNVIVGDTYEYVVRYSAPTAPLSNPITLTVY